MPRVNPDEEIRTATVIPFTTPERALHDEDETVETEQVVVVGSGFVQKENIASEQESVRAEVTTFSVPEFHQLEEPTQATQSSEQVDKTSKAPLMFVAAALVGLGSWAWLHCPKCSESKHPNEYQLSLY